MNLVVADASALVEYLLQTPFGRLLGPLVRGTEADLHVPALCDVEVVSAFRCAIRLRKISAERAGEALRDYQDLPVTRHAHTALLTRALALRDNFSSYDATYIALAERIGASLLTGDERLVRSVETHLPKLQLAWLY